MALYEWALHKDPGLSDPFYVTFYWSKHFVTHLGSIWPKDQLGDPTIKGETIGLSEASVRQLLVGWKAKYHRDLRRPREAACAAISKTQLYVPSANVRIMDYFKPSQNILVNQGVLMPQQKPEPAAPVHHRSKGTQTAEKTWADAVKSTPQPRQPVGRTPIDEVSPPSTSPDTPATLPLTRPSIPSAPVTSSGAVEYCA